MEKYEDRTCGTRSRSTINDGLYKTSMGTRRRSTELDASVCTCEPRSAKPSNHTDSDTCLANCRQTNGFFDSHE